MTITIGTLSFDNVEYDADADVLYLSVGEPRMPAESFATPKGHNIRYDETGAVIATTIVNAKLLLDRDGELKLTSPAACRQPTWRSHSPADSPTSSCRCSDGHMAVKPLQICTRMRPTTIRWQLNLVQHAHRRRDAMRCDGAPFTPMKTITPIVVWPGKLVIACIGKPYSRITPIAVVLS